MNIFCGCMDNAGSRDFSNQSKLVFARSIEYVVIYLHGFTDDGDEGSLFSPLLPPGFFQAIRWLCHPLYGRHNAPTAWKTNPKPLIANWEMRREEAEEMKVKGHCTNTWRHMRHWCSGIETEICNYIAIKWSCNVGLRRWTAQAAVDQQ